MLLRSAAAVDGGIRRSHSYEQLTSLANHGTVPAEPPMPRSQSHEQLTTLNGGVVGISKAFDPLFLDSPPRGTPVGGTPVAGGGGASRRTFFQGGHGGPGRGSKHSPATMSPIAAEGKGGPFSGELDSRSGRQGSLETDVGLFHPLSGLHRRRHKGQLGLSKASTGLSVSSPEGMQDAERAGARDEPTLPLATSASSGEVNGPPPARDELVLKSTARGPKEEVNGPSSAIQNTTTETLAASEPSQSAASKCEAFSEEESSSERQSRCLKRRKSASLMLLNVLAAMHGTNSVASKVEEQMTPMAPTSLTSAVRGLSAAIVFAPALKKAIARQDASLLWAGMELGAWLFLGGLLQTLGKAHSTQSSAPLLFTFSLVFVPVMELCAGKSVSKLTWLATVAALSGMGLLAEEGMGWNGIMLPKVTDLWTLASSLISGIHIFRSEALGSKYDSLELNAVQMVSLAALGVGWECFEFFTTGHGDIQQLLQQVETLPWAPLLYSGLVCSGLANWLELKGLRNVHASTATLIYTTIPIWGGFFSLLSFGDVPGTSATVGAAFIFAASVCAQITKPLAEQEGSVSTAAAVNPPMGQDKTKGESERLLAGTEAAELEGTELDSPGGLKTTSVDVLPGALLTSQLKFPYYAAQVQQMLAKAKLKAAAVKAAAVSAHAHTLAAAGGHVATAMGTGAVAGSGVHDFGTFSAVVAAGISNMAESTAAVVGATVEAAGGIAQQTLATSAEALVGTVEAVIAPTAEALVSTVEAVIAPTAEFTIALADTTEGLSVVQAAGETAIPANGFHMAEACVKAQSTAADAFLHLVEPAAKIFPPLGELAHASTNIDLGQLVHDFTSPLVHIHM